MLLGKKWKPHYLSKNDAETTPDPDKTTAEEVNTKKKKKKGKSQSLSTKGQSFWPPAFLPLLELLDL